MTPPNTNPEDRDLFDFADAVNAGANPEPHTDLEHTYLRVQHALSARGLAAPASTRQQIWEDTMDRLVTAPPAPISNRTRRAREATYGSRQIQRQRSWRPSALFTMAATVLMLLGGLGAWSAFRNDGETPPPAPQHLAGLAPVPGVQLQVATPAPAYACDFSEDMPILESSGSTNLTGTFFTWQHMGDLKLHCDGEQSEIVLASNVYSAGPVEGIPGVLFVYTVDPETSDASDGTSTYLNVMTGKSFTSGSMNVDRGFFQQTSGEYQSGPFLLVNDEDGLLTVLDTRSMTDTPVATIFGPSSPESFNLVSASSIDGEFLAMMLGNADAANSGAFPMPTFRGADIGAPGDIVLLNTTTGDALWLTVPTTNEVPTGLSVSPDGSMIAVSAVAITEDFNPPTRIIILDTNSGDVVAQTDTFQSFDLQMIWTSRGLVAQGAQEIFLVPTDGSPVSTLYSQDASSTTVSGLKPTLNPDIVVASSVYCEGECRLESSNVGVVAINVVTGETKRYAGQDVGATVGWLGYNGPLVLVDTSVVFPDPTTYTVIDPSTGDEIATLQNMPGIGIIENQRPIIGPHSISQSVDGHTTIIGVGIQHIIMLHVDDAGPSVVELPVPGRFSDSTANPASTVFLSPSGTTLFAMVDGDEEGAQFLLDLSNPDAEWQVIESTDPVVNSGYILFVEGVPGD